MMMDGRAVSPDAKSAGSTQPSSHRTGTLLFGHDRGDDADDDSSDTESIGIEAGEEYLSSAGEKRFCVGMDDSLYNLPFDKRTLEVRLKQLRGKAHPDIPDHPAPVEPPTHENKIPTALVVPLKVDSQLTRTLNSSAGRCFTFCCSYVCLGLAVVALTNFQDNTPGPNDTGTRKASFLFLAILSLVCVYVCCPMLSDKAGMHPRAAGWKTYMSCYRLSFICALPALVCFTMGWGQEIGFGEADGELGKRLMFNLTGNTSKYFEAADGYVALNLTKGIVSTVVRTGHSDGGGPRRSRFRNAELLINKEPYTGLTKPTVLPGVFQYFVIAPIFSNWKACESYYEISTNCLEQNAVVGWALASGRSLCNNMNLVACNTDVPVLRPSYKCSTDKVYGREATGAIEGLCGRVVQPPPSEVFDELSALFVTDGWPRNFLPNPDQIWVDVTPDPCIDDPNACLKRWRTFTIVAYVFTFLTVCCIGIPCCIDYSMDKRIREVKRYWDEKQAANKIMG
jgi:hypothetical protein